MAHITKQDGTWKVSTDNEKEYRAWLALGKPPVGGLTEVEAESLKKDIEEKATATSN